MSYEDITYYNDPVSDSKFNYTIEASTIDSKKNEDKFSFLSAIQKSILENNTELFKDSIKKYISAANGDKEIRSDAFSQALWFAGLRPNYEDFKEIFHLAKINQPEQIKEFAEVCKTNLLVRLFASSDSTGVPHNHIHKSLFLSALEEIDFDGQQDLRRVLGYMQDSDMKIVENNPDISYARILDAPFTNHAAYFIIKYNKSCEPIQIGYCDGNLLHDSNYGEVVFDIDPEKLAIINKEGIGLEQYIKKEFAHIYENNAQNARSDFDSKMLNIAKEENGTPKIVARNVPTTYQHRTNCAAKSTKIAIGALLQLDSSMTPEIDSDDKKSGRGYELYKRFGKEISRNSVIKLLEISEREDFDSSKPYYRDVINTLGFVLIQAVRKEDHEEDLEKKKVYKGLQNRLAKTLVKHDAKLVESFDERNKGYVQKAREIMSHINLGKYDIIVDKSLIQKLDQPKIDFYNKDVNVTWVKKMSNKEASTSENTHYKT